MDLLQCYDSSSSEEEETGNAEQGKVTISSVKKSGAVRQQEHIDGNWAGLCFHAIPAEDIDVPLRDELLQEICSELELAGYTGHCQVHDEFHISMSRPFYLREANLQPFVLALQRHIRESNTIRRFRVEIDSESSTILTNDDATRSFLVWRVYHAEELLDVVGQCDHLLRQYQQPPYYEDPGFHVSLASFVPAVSEKVCRKVAQMLRNRNANHANNESPVMSTTVKTLCVKFGTTKMFVLELL